MAGALCINIQLLCYQNALVQGPTGAKYLRNVIYPVQIERGSFRAIFNENVKTVIPNFKNLTYRRIEKRCSNFNIIVEIQEEIIAMREL